MASFEEFGSPDSEVRIMMHSRFWNCFGLAALSISLACTHSTETGASVPTSDMSHENVRLAQARVEAGNGAAVQGFFNFEQMPNSVIITYKLEGLQPKATYRILLQENQDCQQIDLTAANSLRELKASKSGSSENTFKTVEYSISGSRSLLGHTLIVAAAPDSRQPARSSELTPIACARVQPGSAISQIQ